MLERMRELRKQKNLTLKQLADIIGVAEVTVSTYERGTREPPLSVLCAIADTLGVSLDELVRGKQKEPFPEDRERLKGLIVEAFADLSPQEKKIAEFDLQEISSFLDAYETLSDKAKKAFWSHLIKSIRPTHNGFDFTLNYT